MSIFWISSVNGCVAAYIACRNQITRILSSGELQRYAFPEVKSIRNAPAETDEAQTERKEEPAASGQVLALCVSPSGRQIAAVNDRKTACIWGTDGAVVASWQTARKASCLCFSKDEQYLLVADKSGDIYRCSLSEPDVKPNLLLGHISMVLDMVMTADGRHVITCDRDEKVRVTRYPAVHCIDAYCLGHREFVTCLRLTRRARLLSSGGDMTVRLWDPCSGRQLACASVAASATDSSGDGQKVAVTSLAVVETHSKSVVVAQVHRRSHLAVFNMTEDDRLVPLPDLQLDTTAHSIASAEGRLYVLSVSAREPFTVFNLQDDGCLQKLPASTLTETAARELGESLHESLKTENVDWLFKQWFDNVADYLSRKEERLRGEKAAQGNGLLCKTGKDQCDDEAGCVEDGNAPKRLKQTE